MSFRQERGEEAFGYKRDKRGGGERRQSKLKENRNEGGKGMWKKGESCFSTTAKRLDSILNFIGRYLNVL